MHMIYSENMKRENRKVKKVVSKKSVARDSHTEEIKRYISEVSKDAEKRTNIHLGALTENFKHQVSAVAEQFLGLNEKVDSNARDIHEKLDTHTEMIGRLMMDMEEVKVNLKEKVNQEQFNKLEKHLVSLETIFY